MHILVMAKAPVPGRVKTRLCPPCTPEEAARIAEAALADTLEAVRATGADRLIVALDGEPGPWLPPGFRVIPQRGGRLDERLANAWDDAGAPGLQIAMDTPQVTADLLDAACARLESVGIDAVLGPAADGGWWAIGLRMSDRRVFSGITPSLPTTGALQLARLRELELCVELLPVLTDLDDVAAAVEVAGAVMPSSRTAAALEPFAAFVR